MVRRARSRRAKFSERRTHGGWRSRASAVVPDNATNLTTVDDGRRCDGIAPRAGLVSQRMNATKTAGLGVGAVLAGAAASCPIVQAAVLGMVGGLGFLPFATEHRRMVALAVMACGAVALYGTVRVWRRRRESAPGNL